LEQSSRNGHRVEEAESHCLGLLCVVTWRSDDGKAVLDFTAGRLCGQINHAADRHACCRRGVQLIPSSVRIYSNATAGQADKALDRQLAQFGNVQLLEYKISNFKSLLCKRRIPSSNQTTTKLNIFDQPVNYITKFDDSDHHQYLFIKIKLKNLRQFCLDYIFYRNKKN